MKDFQVNSKIWLENENGRVFGDGPARILDNIEKFGSLRKAAQEMNMSYSQAMEIIKMIEANLSCKVIERHVGGESGGGSTLTQEGKALLKKYQAFRHELSENIEALYQRHFG